MGPRKGDPAKGARSGKASQDFVGRGDPLWRAANGAAERMEQLERADRGGLEDT